jgi:hypothetical protein
MGCANSKQATMTVSPIDDLPDDTSTARCAAPTAIMVRDTSNNKHNTNKKIRTAFGI